MLKQDPTPTRDSMLKTMVEADAFGNLVTFAILFNAFTIGLQTYTGTVATLETRLDISLNGIFAGIDTLVLAIFSIEAIAKISAHGKSYFKDSWNVFDISVIIISLLSFSPLFAVLRVVRVVRLLERIRSLKMISSIILRSASGCLSILGIIFLLLFVFAVAGHALYGQTYPQYFGNLHTAMWSLFKVGCIMGWVEELAQKLVATHPGVYFFLVPYFLLMNFIVLNFFFSIVCLYLEELSYADLRYGKENASEDEETAAPCARGSEVANISVDQYQSLLHELAALRDRIRKKKLSCRPTG